MSKENKNMSTNVKEQPTNEQTVMFTTLNYCLMVAGIVLLGLGYILLSGGGSDNPNEFNNAMFDTRRLVIAPICITLGLIVEICAIMYRDKKNKNK